MRDVHLLAAGPQRQLRLHQVLAGLAEGGLDGGEPTRRREDAPARRGPRNAVERRLPRQRPLQLLVRGRCRTCPPAAAPGPTGTPSARSPSSARTCRSPPHPAPRPAGSAARSADPGSCFTASPVAPRSNPGGARPWWRPVPRRRHHRLLRLRAKRACRTGQRAAGEEGDVIGRRPPGDSSRVPIIGPTRRRLSHPSTPGISRGWYTKEDDGSAPHPNPPPKGGQTRHPNF